MSGPRILYSTNTLLAYKISKRYYHDKHFVWCSPEFGSVSLTGELLAANPPSSRPYERYQLLARDVRSGDRHSALAAEQRSGLRTGAIAKHDARVITLRERDEVLVMVDAADLSMLKPLIYAIPFEPVKHLVQEVALADCANVTSLEFKIEALPGDAFDVLDLG
jgi:hypothetical protein